jgi:hypothetical protein
MGKLAIALVVIAVVGLVAGAFVLANWQLPAPNQPIEKVLPDARFPK